MYYKYLKTLKYCIDVLAEVYMCPHTAVYVYLRGFEFINKRTV